MEDAETVQTDTVAVRKRLAHLPYDGLAYVFHVFGRHGAQRFNVLCYTGKVEDFGILGLAFQGVDHGELLSPIFLWRCVRTTNAVDMLINFKFRIVHFRSGQRCLRGDGLCSVSLIQR